MTFSIPSIKYKSVQTACNRGVPRLGSRSRQAGFDLIQLSIVVGVIGVLMAAALVGVPRVMNGVRANGAVQDLQAMISSFQTGLATSSFSEAADRSVTGFIRHGFISPSAIVGGTSMRGRFGGDVQIAPDADGYGALAVNVKYPDVPSRVCPSLIMSLQGSVSMLKVGSAELKSGSKAFAATEVAAACQSKAKADAPVSSKPVTIEFVIA